MTGRAEVSRRKQQLDATFGRAATTSHDAELQADLARYLCVLVSGFLEQAVVELLLEHTRTRAGKTVHQYAETTLRHFTNPNAQRLVDLLARFHADWRKDIEVFLVDERKDAVNSIISLRNAIAHGQPIEVTVNRVRRYYDAIQTVVERIANLCV